MSEKKQTVASHLINRLSEVGIKHVFGVPGDYNLELLDYIIENPKITWVGNTNELNAAYAADGYARQQGLSAVVTTYGVGELSAINGIAGAYAEYVPVLHIVGSPLEQSVRAKELIHHTLGDGIFDHFSTCAEQVTVAQTKLSADNAITEIDRILDAILLQKRPGYIELPLSVVHQEIVGEIEPYQPKKAVLNQQAFDALSIELKTLLNKAERPVLLAGFLVESFGLKTTVRSLVSQSNIPNVSLFMGKGVLDESKSSYLGSYSGSASEEDVLSVLDNADLILSVGVKYVDNITASFSHPLRKGVMVDFQANSVSVKDKVFTGISLQDSINLLTTLISNKKWEVDTVSYKRVDQIALGMAPLTQHMFWNAIQSFIRDGDIIVAEQGTSFFGSVALQIGPNTSYIGQPLWGSIGYTLPATYGVMTAQPERRTLLFIGDGSALLTLQELSSMQRDQLHPIIFLINNNGYTVERAIHGAEMRYNDIPAVNWKKLAQALNLNNKVETHTVSNGVELLAALEKAEKSDVMQFIEVHVDVMDLPPQLKSVSEGIAAKNAKATEY